MYTSNMRVSEGSNSLPNACCVAHSYKPPNATKTAPNHNARKTSRVVTRPLRTKPNVMANQKSGSKYPNAVKTAAGLNTAMAETRLTRTNKPNPRKPFVCHSERKTARSRRVNANTTASVTVTRRDNVTPLSPNSSPLKRINGSSANTVNHTVSKWRAANTAQTATAATNKTS